MGKCRYDLSADCHGHDCLSCMLDKIRAEIEQEYKVESEHPYGQGLRRALEIIDKYLVLRTESNRVF